MLPYSNHTVLYHRYKLKQFPNHNVFYPPTCIGTGRWKASDGITRWVSIIALKILYTYVYIQRERGH